MLLRLPHSLHYPVSINKVQAPVGSRVKPDDPLFIYSYVTKVTQGQRYSDEEEQVDKEFVAEFKSTLEGTIKSWRVWDKDVIREPLDVVEIEEECAHVVQYLGMCTNCGADMTQARPGETQNVQRATIQTLHDNQYLTISREEANKLDEQAKRRLIRDRKMSLVVDLDQTIIHAAVDPTIAEWQQDKDNPNHEALQDVKAFQLKDEVPGMRPCWYYIKLRPGLQDFLEHVSQLYELHIYTMGTRQYATEIALIVDPDKRYFGDRILSRDESGSMAVKNLERLFPVDTKMVVIIDDRGDVWKWSANLIRVTPFDFFVGIGDINSAYLPRRQEIQTTPASSVPPTTDGAKGTEQVPSQGDGTTNGLVDDDAGNDPDDVVLEQLVHMGASDDPAVQALQTKGQEAAISSQLEDKPLLKMQQKQDEQDEAEATDRGSAPSSDVHALAAQSTETETAPGPPSASADTTLSASKSKTRHSILKTDDEELVHLEARLTDVHKAFFREYDRKRTSGKGGRVAALSGNKKIPLGQEADDSALAELQIIPDVKKVMPAMKTRVLSGVTIVLSGVLPLGTDVQNADISIWAKSFGAEITDDIKRRDVTHVIAARVGTAKVRQAIKRGIKVVGTDWLIGSIQRWRKLDEGPYLLEGTKQKHRAEVVNSSDVSGDLLEPMHVTSPDFMLSSSEGDTSTDDEFNDDRMDGPPVKKKPRLQINVEDTDAHIADEFVDDGSPVTINQDEWADMDAELKEFMGSEAEDSDTESVVSSLSFRGKPGSNKRRRGTDDNEPSEGNIRPRPSPRTGGSALKTVSNVEGNGPSKHTDSRDEGSIRRQQQDIERAEHEPEAEEDSDDELARELERELEEADAESE